MLVEIGQYKLDIDIAKTKRFYDSDDRVSQYCTCDGCLNFEKAVDFLSPAVRTLFAVCVESRIVSQAEPSLVGSCQFIDINQMHTVPTAGCPQRRRIASICSYIAQQHN